MAHGPWLRMYLASAVRETQHYCFVRTSACSKGRGWVPVHLITDNIHGTSVYEYEVTWWCLVWLFLHLSLSLALLLLLSLALVIWLQIAHRNAPPWMDETLHLRTPGMLISLKMPTHDSFHGQDFVHCTTYWGNMPQAR